MTLDHQLPVTGQLLQPSSNISLLLQQYATRDNVISTASGLLYRIIDKGIGEQPSWDDSVKVHQRVMLANGRVLYDTRTAGIPVEYEIAEAIDGLQKVLQLMQVGSRFEVMIAPHLAKDIYSSVLSEQQFNSSDKLMLIDITLVGFTKLAHT
ncbi:FKBP-type peptidyl-prolyl cis-trans isomerase [Pseudoalteromonas mariniglutinosa]|uniref:FKBP-type peptidyl-prolyl cis-trans isomerase n=1 Tax=Pseudoalteromonas mariniglutinosa TaxID=206042 RepID=UPI00384E0B76